MPLSFIFRIRRQSVADSLEVTLFLISCRLSRGNDPNRVWLLSVGDGHDSVPEQDEGNEPFFSIVPAIVCHCQRGTTKDAWGVQEIEAMLAEVDLAFPFIPLVSHSLA